MDHAEPTLPDPDHLPLIQLYTRACVHTLNNYLAGVSGYQQLLAMKLEKGVPSDTGRLLEYLKEMETSLSQVEKTLRDLSAWARPKPTRLKAFSLSDRLPPILNTFRQQHPEAAARIERDIPDFPPVRGDEAMLQELLAAVLENAVRATNRNQGSIKVSLMRNRPPGEGKSGIEQSIRVQDAGCGIHPARIPYLQMPILAGYQDFAEPTEDWHGSGFGLPMAFTLARRMGGRLSLNSQPGKGTSVTLTLPESDTE